MKSPNARGRLQDVIVSQSVAVQRKTPVAVSTVTADEITYKLGGQEFPEILKSTPGVYVTKDGGGFGDAKINMRGFQSANVAVMVNGVPVNDMEWGGVYWSNWAHPLRGRGAMVARRLHARRQLHAYDSGNPAARRLAACGVLCGAHGDADRRGVVA